MRRTPWQAIACTPQWIASALGACLAFGASAHAAGYPERQVTLVIPMAAGGPTDTIARAVQVSMSKTLKQPLVIDNRAGAAGMIGIGMVRRAPADGYTLAVASATTHAIATNIYEKIAYDPVKDFTPVGGLVSAPGVLIASRKAAPDCRFQAFLENLQKAPGKMQYGSAGTGSLSHLSGAVFLASTKTDMLHVPYKGLASAMNDLYAGQIDAAFDNVSSALSHILRGKLCALAVQAPARLASLPDVPTFKELGYPELSRPTWYGLVAPAHTPRAVVDTLNKALNQALASPEVRESFARLGVAPAPTTPEQFSAQIQGEIAVWRDVTERMRFEKIKP